MSMNDLMTSNFNNKLSYNNKPIFASLQWFNWSSLPVHVSIGRLKLWELAEDPSLFPEVRDVNPRLDPLPLRPDLPEVLRPLLL